MKHLENIVRLLETLHKSQTFHALVVQSPPGWAKSTTIDQALERLELDYVPVGTYTTPLHLYNLLCEQSDKIIVLDDCAGLFSDARAMAILKAATWSSAGVSGERRIAWGTTSDKAAKESAAFSGKLILLTNTIPSGKESEAFLSRTLAYRIRFVPGEIQEMLLEAAGSKNHFSNTALAQEVAKHIAQGIRGNNPSSINLRTLKMGYEIAQTHPDSWKHLLDTMLPPASPEELVEKLSAESENVNEQQEKFLKLTGLSRRTFFNYRKKLGLDRTNRQGSG